jgi:hypothetical protein
VGLGHVGETEYGSPGAQRADGTERRIHQSVRELGACDTVGEVEIDVAIADGQGFGRYDLRLQSTCQLSARGVGKERDVQDFFIDFI